MRANETGEDDRGVGSYEKHVHLKWLNGIGDHQPESNRCKLNKPKNTAEMFSFQAFVCVLATQTHTHSHTVMNSIFHLLHEI